MSALIAEKFQLPISKWTLITPEIAADYLARNTDNRPLRQVVVNSYVRAMKRGQWKHTRQGIAFYKDGTLADGQHRLEAVRQSGVSVWMLVTCNVEPSSLGAMDQGLRRKAFDFMEGGHKSVQSAAARIVIAIRGLEGYRFTPIEFTRAMRQISGLDVWEYAHTEEDLVAAGLEHASVCNRASRNMPAVGPGPLLGAGLLAKHSDEWFEALRQIAEVEGLDKDDPLRVLARKKFNKGDYGQGVAAMYAIKTMILRDEWLDSLAGGKPYKPVKSLRVGSVETFAVEPV